MIASDTVIIIAAVGVVVVNIIAALKTNAKVDKAQLETKAAVKEFGIFV